MAATVRTECAACGGALSEFLNLGSSPLADHFVPNPGDEPQYPLRAALCKSCGLAQLLDVVDDRELFGTDYGFRTAGSPALVEYYKQWAAWALKLIGGPAAVVDIGCNDGTLLRNFQRAGCKVIGVEPSAAGNEAAGRGIEVFTEPLTKDCAREIVAGHGPAGLVTAINVAAHVQDPVEFLTAVGMLLGEHGTAVVEFQDLERLVAGCQIDHVYHEHRFFYSVRTFSQVAWQAGLQVKRTMITDGQGGSIRAVLQHASSARPPDPAQRCLDDWWQLQALQQRAEFMRTELVHELERLAMMGTLAGYGATAKSATLLNFCGIGPGLLSYIEDATPSKAGCVTPGTHIPIVMAGERPRPSAYLLLAWNYLGAVLRREREFLQAGGKFVVPVPVPVTI